MTATGSTTKTVMTTSAGPLASDSFSRTATAGWGNADAGGAWTLVGAGSVFSVANGVGKISLAKASAGPSAYLNTASTLNSEVVVDAAFDKMPGGGGAYVALASRHTSSGEYRAKVLVSSAGAVTLFLVKVAGATETTLKTLAVPGLTYTTADSLRIRFNVTGTSPATLTAKIWKVGTTEPAAAQVTATDTTAALQVAGGFGLWTYLSGTATNAPVAVLFDNLAATAK